MLPLYSNPSESPFYLPIPWIWGFEPGSYIPISRFPLFKLSEEAVHNNLILFSGTDRAALVLVDRDSHQLARTRQFPGIWINFSNASMDLLRALVEE